jgi:hypothetical protein
MLVFCFIVLSILLIFYCSCFNLLPLPGYLACHETVVDNATPVVEDRDDEIVPLKTKRFCLQLI